MRPSSHRPHPCLALYRCAALLLILFGPVLPALAGSYPAGADTAQETGADTPVRFLALGYHDVRDNLARHYDPDPYAVTAEHLAGHFRWLAEQGYTVISMDDVLAARAGTRPLPDRSVLLTFDDGFRSVYSHVFPLLKAFGYPAVVSLVTGWIEAEQPVPYNGERLSAEAFLDWPQIREMVDSGLVEIASHSHDMHRGITGNPQGNEQPAATTFAWTGDRYENITEYEARVRADLERSTGLIESKTGFRPRVITWPYGAWNESTRQTAAQLGMSVSLTLDRAGGIDGRGIIGREMLVANPGLERFVDFFAPQSAPVPMRAAQVDLDYVYDPDPERQEANLGLLLDRMQAMGVNTVFLQAFADPDGDGAADATYFPNRHLPVRADLFNRAAWQLRTRAGVAVYAWMPVTAFTSPVFPDAWRVLEWRGGNYRHDPHGEPRLSVFLPEARAIIREIYQDLARHAAFAGLHFHDDARLSDREDANPAALAAYGKSRDASVDPGLLFGDKPFPDWARTKSRALTRFTRELAGQVRYWHPQLKTSRNLFASALLHPDGERFLAQRYEDFLAAYDHTVVMAMPRLEGYRNERRFYRDLLSVIREHPGALKQTTFQLQARDWRTGRWLSGRSLRQTMHYLRSRGVANLAYYPDDFIRGQPDLKQLSRGISTREHPAGVRR